MYTVTVWNKQSTNYGANAFVEARGTDKFSVLSENRGLTWIGYAIMDENIDRAILDTPNGQLVWQRNTESSHDDNYGDNYDQEIA